MNSFHSGNLWISWNRYSIKIVCENFYLYQIWVSPLKNLIRSSWVGLDNPQIILIMYLELRRMFPNFITASNHSVAPKSLRIIGLKSGILGSPGGSDSKDSTCNAEDLGSIPGLGRFPWRRAWQPTPVFLPKNPYGQRSLAGYSP